MVTIMYANEGAGGAGRDVTRRTAAAAAAGRRRRRLTSGCTIFNTRTTVPILNYSKGSVSFMNSALVYVYLQFSFYFS